MTGSGAASTSAIATTGVGTAAIVAGAGTLSANNYDFTDLQNGVLTIDKAHLTVTASNDIKVFDGFSYSGGNGVVYSGLVNDETSDVLGGSVTYGGSSQGALHLGDYVLSPSGLSSSNYLLQFVDGNLSIVPKPPEQPPLVATMWCRHRLACRPT